MSIGGPPFVGPDWGALKTRLLRRWVISVPPCRNDLAAPPSSGPTGGARPDLRWPESGWKCRAASLIEGQVMAEQAGSVEEYIQGYPDDVQAILWEIRRRISGIVPDSGETISYQMPTVTMSGEYLVYYAAWKQHIGMYPIPTAEPALEERLAPYRAAKDAVRFTYRKPIPYDLIDDMVAMMVRHRLDSENDPKRGD